MLIANLLNLREVKSRYGTKNLRVGTLGGPVRFCPFVRDVVELPTWGCSMGVDWRWVVLGVAVLGSIKSQSNWLLA